jgi:hypothetical protein
MICFLNQQRFAVLDLATNSWDSQDMTRPQGSFDEVTKTDPVYCPRLVLYCTVETDQEEFEMDCDKKRSEIQLSLTLINLVSIFKA